MLVSELTFRCINPRCVAFAEKLVKTVGAELEDRGWVAVVEDPYCPSCGESGEFWETMPKKKRARLYMLWAEHLSTGGER